VDNFKSSKIITKGPKGMQGYFSAIIFDEDQCTYVFEKPNKVVEGSKSLIIKFLASHTQGWNPGVTDIGITKFVLFGIDDSITTPDCKAQMLIGNFGEYYSNLDPILLSEITNVSFPCLKSMDTIEATIVPVNNCAGLTNPPEDTSYISSDVGSNYIDICVRVGAGYVTAGSQKYYAMAALVGKSTNPVDTNEYVLALEQFPVMIKNSSNLFRFIWQVYF